MRYRLRVLRDRSLGANKWSGAPSSYVVEPLHTALLCTRRLTHEPPTGLLVSHALERPHAKPQRLDLFEVKALSHRLLR